MVALHSLAVFWDFENCPPPSSSNGYEVVSFIRSATERFGAINSIKAYSEIRDVSQRYSTTMSELQASGISLVNCPHNGYKDVVDKMMIVDILLYAMENPNVTLVLIAGDRDYAYLVSTLRLRKREVIVIVPSSPVHTSLVAHASHVLRWDSIVQYPNESTEHRSSAVFGCHVEFPQSSNFRPNYAPLSTFTEAPQYMPAPKHPNSKPVRNHREDNDYHSGSNTSSATAISMPELDGAPTCTDTSPGPNELPAELLTTSPLYATPYTVAATAPASHKQISALDVDVGSPIATDLKEAHIRPLIDVLTSFAAMGNTQPLRSRVSAQLTSQYPGLYKNAGVTQWKEYAALACKSGKIQLGGFAGKAWVSLCPDVEEQCHDKPAPEIAPLLTPNSIEPQPLIPLIFLSLARLLQRCREQGLESTLRTFVCQELNHTMPDLLIRHGMCNWKSYLAKAEEEGVVNLLEDNRISLHPKWHDKMI